MTKSLELEEYKNVTDNTDGIQRMRKSWRDKLWIEFDRDNDIKILTINDGEEVTDAFKGLEELRIDNHTASVEYLTQFLEHVQFPTGNQKLKRLEIVKVLFTTEKA